MAKLIRDNVPDIIRAQGGNPSYHVASSDEYWEALLAKFKEEVDEFLDNPNEAEFSDILEVIDEIVKLKGGDRIAWMREEKRKRKGAFSKRLILDSE